MATLESRRRPCDMLTGRDAPIGRVGESSPDRYVRPNLMDDQGRVVLLLDGGQALGDAQREAALPGLGLQLPGLGDRGQELRASAPLRGREVRRLPARVQSVVAGGLLTRRVQDWTIEESLGQAWPPGAASFVRVKPTG